MEEVKERSGWRSWEGQLVVVEGFTVCGIGFLFHVGCNLERSLKLAPTRLLTVTLGHVGMVHLSRDQNLVFDDAAGIGALLRT